MKCMCANYWLEKRNKASGSLALPSSNLVANPSCLEADVTTGYDNK